MTLLYEGLIPRRLRRNVGVVDYENTEVAYENRPINPAVCKLSLRDRLTTEYIYKVSVDGQIVAKTAQ